MSILECLTHMANLHDPYLLLADDDEEDQEMLSEAFVTENPDARIVTCMDGRAALEILTACKAEELPALMLLDFKMPFITASELLIILEKDPAFRDIPKIVWSTSNNSMYVDACIEHGASRYFSKPSGMAELRQIVAFLSKLFRQRVHGA